MSFDLHRAFSALRAWGRRQWAVAVLAALGSFLLIGVATVLIPNPIFGRDIAPVWWNYPVWILTSVLMGLLMATYIKGTSAMDAKSDSQTTTVGMIGGMLAWFAVGCPVCNKLALLALGYSGALTWFAPVQPWLGAIAMVLTGAALIVRLNGQITCAIKPPRQRRSISV
ncbi:hypothetical protein INS90_09035 [Trueperella pecoris]|uniref:Uncharacterized protein n=1 Tax=Trueperella pecoris TaxID=2733571 RepID=A0A7M1QZR7_9ACTO|nr:hypothetical protein [Trueperella pecoris]QOR47383.1 hypothetical protein INS90_09035 [Trueperella pecoris]